MIPRKNKKASADLLRHFDSNWSALAEFLDTIALDKFRGAPQDSASYILGKRLRAVANFARDPYKKKRK